MVTFALDWLAGLYGTDVKRALTRAHATRWNDTPWVLGASSVAAPGGQSARRTLMEPLQNRIWFAGEAVHERLWGTVGGAWESGDRAAQAALRVIAPPPRPQPEPKSKPKPKQPKQTPKQKPSRG
jgi:monoamine oxidase